MRDTPRREFEAQEPWTLFYGAGGREKRAQALAEFEAMFPEGHAHSLRSLVSDLAEIAESGAAFTRENLLLLNDFHPRAFGLLEEYGIDYRPWPLRKVFGLHRPVKGGCFGNSLFLTRVRSPRLFYVEGLAFGVVVNPMLHAWNTPSLQSTWAIDWTHYVGGQWSRYLGIPFVSDEYTFLWETLDPSQSSVDGLFTKKNFPVIEEAVRKILASRVSDQKL